MRHGLKTQGTQKAASPVFRFFISEIQPGLPLEGTRRMRCCLPLEGKVAFAVSRKAKVG